MSRRVVHNPYQHLYQSLPWCGCYLVVNHARQYLPVVDFNAHTTIYSSASSTTLTQTFVNPSTTQPIKNLRYTFPLYDGVSVVDFTCEIDDKLIKGIVKEKDEARATFNEAVERGESAGLLEQSPDAGDVFSTEIGNVPAGSKVNVKIVYVGELKHDAEVDGTRFAIPANIAPRYGSTNTYLKDTAHADKGRISITVDVSLNDKSPIQKLQSPSHPVSVSVGTLSTAPDEDPSFTRGHATLTLGSAELDKDFVLQICAKNAGAPFALLEHHPSITGYRAVMASLVPKFSLRPERPEIIFVVDRSGSMQDRVEMLKTAMTLLIKSCPAGVKFNICWFGSRCSLVWEKSQPYSETNVKRALGQISGMKADYGGTETLMAMETTIKSRFKDLSTEIILLTDGQIWDQERLFKYVREEVQKSKGALRVFSLGIGSGVSSALIEGVARAGNGFAQMVGEREIIDTKVLRMLKGALSPHLTNCAMEVKFSDDSVEKVSDSLRVDLKITERTSGPSTRANPISFYEEDTTMTGTEEAPLSDSQSKYAHLPSINPPKLLQAPAEIPPLFPFSRFTAFVLVSPDGPSADPTSVVLRADSPQGPLELEMPVEVPTKPSKMVHQLAVRKACQELEEGAGWLSLARDSKGTLIKSSHEGRFDQLLEREAVRLGVKFQVGGKFTSFVAVQANKNTPPESDEHWTEIQRPEIMTAEEDESLLYYSDEGMNDMQMAHVRFGRAAAAMSALPPAPSSMLARMTSSVASSLGMSASQAPPAPGSSTTGVRPRLASTTSHKRTGVKARASTGGMAPRKQLASKAARVIPLSVSPPESRAKYQYQRRSSTSSPESPSGNANTVESYDGDAMDAMFDTAASFKLDELQSSDHDTIFSIIIKGQWFDGSWSPEVVPEACCKGGAEAIRKAAAAIKLDKAVDIDTATRERVFATALVLSFLEQRMPERRESVEMIVDKAKEYMDAALQGNAALQAQFDKKAEELVA